MSYHRECWHFYDRDGRACDIAVLFVLGRAVLVEIGLESSHVLGYPTEWVTLAEIKMEVNSHARY